jgi:hypothetical protein
MPTLSPQKEMERDELAARRTAVWNRRIELDETVQNIEGQLWNAIEKEKLYDHPIDPQWEYRARQKLSFVARDLKRANLELQELDRQLAELRRLEERTPLGLAQLFVATAEDLLGPTQYRKLMTEAECRYEFLRAEAERPLRPLRPYSTEAV